MELTRQERETIIVFNEEEKTAKVFTYNGKLQRKLKDLAEKFPDHCIFDFENGHGGVSYTVNKKLVSIKMPQTKVMTEEQRQAAAERMRALRQRQKEQQTCECC